MDPSKFKASSAYIEQWHRVADIVHTERKKKEHLLNCCKSEKSECELFHLHGELNHLQFKYFELYDSNILKKSCENFCVYIPLLFITLYCPPHSRYRSHSNFYDLKFVYI